jgi:hypothetical protein
VGVVGKGTHKGVQHRERLGGSSLVPFFFVPARVDYIVGGIRLEERRTDSKRKVQESKKTNLERMLRSTQLAVTLSVEWMLLVAQLS